MKKLLVVVISLLLFPAIASAAVKQDAATIASSYCAWSSAFGATDISWEDDIQDDPDNDTKMYMYIDDLIIKFDISGQRFDVDWVLFQCNAHSGGTSAYNMARKLALFAALEYGPPTTLNDKEIDEAYAIAQEAFNDYSIAMVTNQKKLFDGGFVVFRMNEHGRYSLFYNSNAGFCVSVE